MSESVFCFFSFFFLSVLLLTLDHRRPVVAAGPERRVGRVRLERGVEGVAGGFQRRRRIREHGGDGGGDGVDSCGGRGGGEGEHAAGEGRPAGGGGEGHGSLWVRGASGKGEVEKSVFFPLDDGEEVEVLVVVNRKREREQRKGKEFTSSRLFFWSTIRRVCSNYHVTAASSKMNGRSAPSCSSLDRAEND